MRKLYLRSQDFVTGVLFARLPGKDPKQPAKLAFSAGFHVCIIFPLHAACSSFEPDFRKSSLSRGSSCFERLQPSQNFFAERSHANASKGRRIGLESPQRPSQ
jgi:hypothetical protein